MWCYVYYVYIYIYIYIYVCVYIYMYILPVIRVLCAATLIGETIAFEFY